MRIEYRLDGVVISREKVAEMLPLRDWSGKARFLVR